ncbi:MAG: hypothetical protein ACAI35_18905 [Candidatus Methylacidiphilales bacterium]
MNIRTLLSIVFFVSTISCISLQAAAREPGVKLLLKPQGGETPATLQVISTSEGAKVTGNVTLDQSVGDQWKTVSIQFKASADTDIKMRISAVWSKDDTVKVFLDNVKIKGATIVNPDFEEGSKIPLGWQFLKSGLNSAQFISDASTAASGSKYIKISHGTPAIQNFRVAKDAEVTITLSVKAAPME